MSGPRVGVKAATSFQCLDDFSDILSALEIARRKMSQNVGGRRRVPKDGGEGLKVSANGKE